MTNKCVTAKILISLFVSGCAVSNTGTAGDMAVTGGDLSAASDIGVKLLQAADLKYTPDLAHRIFPASDLADSTPDDLADADIATVDLSAAPDLSTVDLSGADLYGVECSIDSDCSSNGSASSCCAGRCVDLTSDVANCGACGTSCSSFEGTPSCSGGHCAWSCSNGWAHCGGNNTGCETDTTSPSNCGGCGRVCDTLTSTGASCDGTTCHYTACAVDHVNCNMVGADTNGCECVGDACCASGCQVTHTDGLGESFYDCVAASTYTAAEAMAACLAHTGDVSTCATFQCQPQSGNTVTDGVVCDQNGIGDSCNCWDFNAAGHTGIAAGSIDSGCLCPYPGETPQWN